MSLGQSALKRVFLHETSLFAQKSCEFVLSSRGQVTQYIPFTAWTSRKLKGINVRN